MVRNTGVFPVVAIPGARRAGKTTLAKMFISDLDKETVNLDLENPVDAAGMQNPVACIEIKFTDSPKKTKRFTIAKSDLNTLKNCLIVPYCDHSCPLDEKTMVCDSGYFLKNFPDFS